MAEIKGRLPANLPTNKLKSAVLRGDNCSQFPHSLLPAKGPTIMTIAFSCPECDKTFKVSDDMAGRKGKCNNCGATMLIPNKIGATAKRGLGRKSTDEPDEEEDWQDEDEPRGRVRRGRDEDDDYEVAQSRSRSRDDEVDDEIDDDGRPRRRKRRKKKSGSRMALWVSLASAGALLFLGGGYFVLAFAIGIWPFSSSSAEAMKFMPDNCKFLVSVKWSEMENSKVFDDQKKENPNFLRQFGDTSDKDFGYIMKKGIVELMVGASSVPSAANPSFKDDFIVVVTTKDSMSVSELKENGAIESSAKESTINGYKVYEGSKGATCFVNSRMIVGGMAPALRKVLERKGKPEFSSTLKAGLDMVSFSKTITAVVDLNGMIPKGAAQQGRGPGGPANPLGDLGKMAEEAELLVLEASLGNDVVADLTLSCKSAKGAEDIKKALDGLTALAKLAPGVPKEATSLLDSFKLTVSGSNLKASVTIKGDTLKSLAKNPLMGGGFGGPPGGGFNPPAPGGVIPGGNRPPGGPGGVKPPAGPGGNRPPRGGGLRPPNSP
jgi:hypothetical protein